MKTRLATVAMFVLVCFAGIWANAADAKDAKGCEGLGKYNKAMLDAGRAYVEIVTDDNVPPSRDPLSFSSEDWKTLAEHVADFQKAMKAIDPPSFAKEWHQTRIEWAGLLEQASKTAADNGIMAMLVFSDSFDENEANTDKALEDAVAVCADFATFEHDWAALDGDIDGTPVATPTP